MANEMRSAAIIIAKTAALQTLVERQADTEPHFDPLACAAVVRYDSHCGLPHWRDFNIGGKLR